MALASSTHRSACKQQRLRALNAARKPRVAAAALGRNASLPAFQQQGKEWLESILARFGPTTDRAQNVATLEFEKPLVELDKRIMEVGGGTLPREHPHACVMVSAGETFTHFCPQVRKVAEENGVDVSQQIVELETRAQQVGQPLQRGRERRAAPRCMRMLMRGLLARPHTCPHFHTRSNASAWRSHRWPAAIAAASGTRRSCGCRSCDTHT